MIKKVKDRAANDGLVIIDAPPGTSCPVIEAIKGADFCLLVTEPTPFGLNDLKLAVGMARELKLPFVVVINRSGLGDKRVHQYCLHESIQIILELPDDRQIAEAYSVGKMIVSVMPEYENEFASLYKSVLENLEAKSDDWEFMERITCNLEAQKAACKVLGVPKGADMNSLKKAYRRASLKYHPDHNQDDPDANKKFALVKCAYELLAEDKPCPALLEEIKSWSGVPEDDRYKLDSLWGHFLWWREKFFG